MSNINIKVGSNIESLTPSSLGVPYNTMSEIPDSLYLIAGGLYLLSGPPASGKSRFISRNPISPSMVVSADALRKSLLGAKATRSNEGATIEVLSERANTLIFDILVKSVEARLSEGLTTFVDVTAINDHERKDFAALAAKYGVPFRVLIFKKLEFNELVLRDSTRARTVGSKIIQSFYDNFESTSSFPFSEVTSDTYVEVVPRQILSSNLDVVGDVHGLLNELISLLQKAGWNVDPDTLEVSHSDPDRKLLFLGDLVDRGYDSIGVVNLVRKAVLQGKAYCIKGNHERKLVSFIRQVKAGPLEGWSSYANADTGCEVFKKLNEAELSEFTDFLHFLPTNFVFTGASNKFAFVHADVDSFNPFTTHAYSMTNGDSSYDQHRKCDKIYGESSPEFKLIRGHFPLKDLNDSVVSLDNKGYEKGSLMLLQFDKFISELEVVDRSKKGHFFEAFRKCVIEQKSDYSFGAVGAKYSLIKAFNSLIDEKLVYAKTHESGLFKIYKYASRVFYDNLWSEHPALLRARGIVLDIAGNIIANPFTKVFNYAENGAGLDIPDDTEVIVVEKLNGFLGVISYNPFNDSLLYSTSGTFDSEFVGYIQEMITPAQKGKLFQELKENPNNTFTFEVIHPKDPHIVEYPPEMMGLHLIGVRGNGINDEVLTEEEIDKYGAKLGFSRPRWYRTTIGKIKEFNKTCNHEGFMVRANTRIQEYLFKLKSPFYLTTKFMGRMGDGNIKFMFNSPAEFKKRIDEEFYVIVDNIVTDSDIEEFLAKSKDDRIAFVRQLSIKVVS